MRFILFFLLLLSSRIHANSQNDLTLKKLSQKIDTEFNQGMGGAAAIIYKGKVVYKKYHPGKYLVAWHEKSSTENERTTVAVESLTNHQVVFRQIAGYVARRIVFYCKEGDEAKAGHEFGFIKFGSRMDVFLPLDTEITCKIGDITKGGLDVIARMNAE